MRMQRGMGDAFARGVRWVAVSCLAIALTGIGPARAGEVEDARARLVQQKKTQDLIETQLQRPGPSTGATGVPSLLRERESVRRGWMPKLWAQAEASLEAARNAANEAERVVWLRDAQSKLDTHERILEEFVGSPIRRAAAAIPGAPASGDTSARLPSAAEVVGAIREESAWRERFQGAVDHIAKSSVEVVGPEASQRVTARHREFGRLAISIEETLRKAQEAETPRESLYWLGKAQQDREALRLVGRAILDDSAVERTQELLQAFADLPALVPMEGFASGILHQMHAYEEPADSRIHASDPSVLVERADREDGGGHAGAGGVSLHLAATVEDLPDVGPSWTAVVENGRLALRGAGRRILFPLLDLEYLAIGIRCAYGGEGRIEGRLLADERDFVVVDTGSTVAGEVVWRRSFLPAPCERAQEGRPTVLDAGPGIGLAAAPQPSTLHVTYYGPIRNTRLGRVLLEADTTIFKLLYGVDLTTGRPVDLAEVSGFQTGLVRRVRAELAEDANHPSPAREPSAEGDAPWWTQSTWYVWVPVTCTLRLSADGDALVFAETRMGLAVWTSGNRAVAESDRTLGVDATERYDDLAKAFPALAALKEAAQSVAVARWLHERGVHVDLDWAKSMSLAPAETPESLRDVSVFVVRTSTGRPWVETEASR